MTQLAITTATIVRFPDGELMLQAPDHDPHQAAFKAMIEALAAKRAVPDEILAKLSDLPVIDVGPKENDGDDFAEWSLAFEPSHGKIVSAKHFR